jgi:hypothetical protein
MQFTLSKLFVIVTMAALATAALLSATHWWARAIATLTVALYAVSAIRAIRLVGRERVFLVTFAAFGSGYLALALCGFGKSLATNYPLAMIVT